MKLCRNLMLGMLVVVLVGCSPTKTPRRTRTSSDSPRKTSSPTEDTHVAKKPADPEPAKKPDEKPKELPAPNPLVRKTADAGILQGEVVWRGQMPAATAKVEECVVLRGGMKVAVKPPVAVRVDPSTNGVRGVMVWLAKGPEPSVAPPASVLLVQSHGRYRPVEQFVAPGTLLRLRTTDDSADFQGSGILRFSQSVRRGEVRQVALPKPGLLTIRSMEHPWMVPAYVRVLEHDYSAITTAQGRFELPQVPPGEYQVILWHPAAGKGNTPVQVSVPVKLAAKDGAAIRWTLP